MTKPTPYQYHFDWSDLAFGAKKPISGLKATFIAAPREISPKRFKELVKTYLPNGNIVLGLSKEPYIAGFEGQPQFKTLNIASVQDVIEKVNAVSTNNKIYTISYFQRELNYLLQKLDFARALFINGSWQYAFHTRDIYYTTANRHLPYELISPFTDKNEAMEYERAASEAINRAFPLPQAGEHLNETRMLEAAQTAAKYSYDYNFQTGLAVGRQIKRGDYEFIAVTHNKIVPYETYAMLNGASREKHFSPPHDLNHYDTVHAEIEMLVKAARHNADLAGSSVFINLLPCPPCSRALCETEIAEVIYQNDHSGGYAILMLEQAGKKVRRILARAAL